MRTTLLLLTILLSACTTPPPKDTREADAKAIRDLESAWVKVAATKDVDAFVAFYTDDASVLTPNAPIFNAKAGIKEGLKPLFTDPHFSLTFLPTRLEVSKSGDMAFTQGPYKLSFSDLRGNKFEDEGKYLTIWRKQADGNWKVVEDTMNSDLPLPPPPE
jgi:uncharacterized protein (TIGR02246 family)